MKSGGRNSKQIQVLRTIQAQLDEKKRQCLQISITCQSLQNYNSILSGQKQRISQQLTQLKTYTDALIDNLKFHVNILQQRNREILVQKRQVQIKYDTLRINSDSMLTQYESYKISRENQFQQLKKKQSEDKKEFQTAQNNYNSALTQHSKLLKEISELRETRQQERESWKNKLADIQREKIQAIDTIKKQMTSKACQMRNKALEIRKQQFQTTTRLTFLQNDQLVRQLQFQSSKTQNILKKNIELQKEVKQLKKCIQIHQSVEKQIVKRNVFAKNMISSLNQQLKLQASKSNGLYREEGEDFIKMKNIATQNQNQKSLHKSRKEQLPNNNQTLRQFQDQANQQEVYEKTAILQQINKALQKNNQEKQSQINNLQKECESLKKQLKLFKNKTGANNCDSIAALLIRYYEQIIKPSSPQIQQQQEKSNQSFDIQSLKQIEIQKWSTECLSKIVIILLNALRPHLSLKTLKVPYFKLTQKEKAQSLDYQSLKQNLHASKYIQALKRHNDKSLENIKNRSITYNIDEPLIRKSSSNHRRMSSTKLSKIFTAEPVAKRFIKPHIIKA